MVVHPIAFLHIGIKSHGSIEITVSGEVQPRKSSLSMWVKFDVNSPTLSGDLRGVEHPHITRTSLFVALQFDPLVVIVVESSSMIVALVAYHHSRYEGEVISHLTLLEQILYNHPEDGGRNSSVVAAMSNQNIHITTSRLSSSEASHDGNVQVLLVLWVCESPMDGLFYNVPNGFHFVSGHLL